MQSRPGFIFDMSNSGLGMRCMGTMSKDVELNAKCLQFVFGCLDRGFTIGRYSFDTESFSGILINASQKRCTGLGF